MILSVVLPDKKINAENLILIFSFKKL